MVQLSFEFASDMRRDAGCVVSHPAPKDTLQGAYERATAWRVALARRLGRPVRLKVTDNRSIMLSAQQKDRRYEVRLHHMFLHAEPDMLDAVARYLCDGNRVAAGKIDRFVEEHRDKYASSRPPAASMRTVGRHHDLGSILQDLTRRHFGGCLDVHITWGRQVRPRRGQRSLQLGTYCLEERLIRIHPVLDQAWVPRFFVEAVVFHEALHHEMPVVVREGRHRYHTAAFKRRERAFEYHLAATRWEKENLWRLLRGR